MLGTVAMPKLHLASLLSVASWCAPAVAQSAHIGPSVLDLQRSYHLGIYSAAIEVPTGAITLRAHSGSLDLASSGAMSGALATWEWTAAGGAFTPIDTFAGGYFVRPDGRVELDFDLQNPGTDVFEAWIATDGSALHMARYELEDEAASVLALAKSSGHTNASLSGTYRVYGQHLELAGASYQTTAANGTVTFDGLGGATFMGTDLFVAANGVTTTSSVTGAGSYTVAPDGALMVAGDRGAIDATGDVFFVLTASATSSEVGMTIGVRVGASYNFAALDGVYTYHAQSHVLGTTPGLPRTETDVGRLVLSANTATTGGYQFTGKTFAGNMAGQSFGWRTVVGPCAHAGGVVTLVGGPPMELVFSANGKYAVGRALDNRSDLWFAMRGCAASTDYGIATPGAGGIEPELGMRTFPTLGNAGWRFAVIDGRGGAATIVAIGFGSGPPSGTPLAGGLLFVDPVQIVATPFVVLSGPTGVPGIGLADLPVAIPSQPGFAGVRLYAQALVLDAAAPGTVAMSRGFEAVLSR